MGQLLVLLKPDTNDINGNIFVDFENSLPTIEEKELYNYVKEKMKPCPALLKSLSAYTGCGDQIRKVNYYSNLKAISKPSKESEEEAWTAVSPAVGKLKEFFDFSVVIDDCFSRLLKHLCTMRGNDTIASNLERYQATGSLFANLLTFALDFDDLKMTNSSIQNDFSYYRRTLTRLKTFPENKHLLENAVVKDDLANRMSLFYAYPTPMLKTLIDSLSNLSSSNSTTIKPKDITDCLSMMIEIPHHAVIRNR
jgi:hypothetical protein